MAGEKGMESRELQEPGQAAAPMGWTVVGRGRREPGSLAHSVVPGLMPGTQSWPPRGSCSEEEFSWRTPRNSYRVMGGTRLSCPRT